MKANAENPVVLERIGEAIFDPFLTLLGQTTFKQQREERIRTAKSMLTVFGNAEHVLNNPKTVSEDIGVDYRGSGGSLWVASPHENRANPRLRRRIVGVNQAAKAGDAGGSSSPPSTGVPSGHNPALDGYSGPRIVINPSTFENEKDAACVAWNEAFRIIMEDMNFEPQSEPTDAQREFFSDTAYADDELMLRRTILARICVFDTSVEDPTDEQIQEAVEFLQNVLEAGYPQTTEEQRRVKRLLDVLSAVPISNERPGSAEPIQPAEPMQPAEPGSRAVELGGETEEDDRKTLGADIGPTDPTQDAKGVTTAEPVETADESVAAVVAENIRPADPTKDTAGPMLPEEDRRR